MWGGWGSGKSDEDVQEKGQEGGKEGGKKWPWQKGEEENDDNEKKKNTEGAHAEGDGKREGGGLRERYKQWRLDRMRRTRSRSRFFLFPSSF